MGLYERRFAILIPVLVLPGARKFHSKPELYRVYQPHRMGQELRHLQQDDFCRRHRLHCPHLAACVDKIQKLAEGITDITTNRQQGRDQESSDLVFINSAAFKPYLFSCTAEGYIWSRQENICQKKKDWQNSTYTPPPEPYTCGF